MRRRWLEATEAWLDAIFPPRCAGCGRTGSHFCARCVAALRPVRPPWCASCGRSIPAGDFCPDCRLDRLPLAAARSAALFDGPLRHAVHQLKYRGRRSAARALAHLLLAPARSLAAAGIDLAPAVVVPVPLHPARERERGYTQAALLARPFAEALGLTCEAGLLRRVRPTPPQVGLSQRQRRLNVRDAFAAAPGVAGRLILLVDDVTTTGSTLGSAAQACLRAGAAQVCAVTLGRES